MTRIDDDARGPWLQTPMGPDAQDTASARARWRTLVRDDLPSAAARGRDWPIALDHCFARVILDAVCGRPWREVLAAPAWRSMDAAMLADAIALAESILDGSADLRALNARSLAGRSAARTHRGAVRPHWTPQRNDPR